MSSDPGLRVDWCSYEAAKFAVGRWHYSRSMPGSRLMHFGVWEDGSFRGAVVFGRGATARIGKPFGLDQVQICELVRIALGTHRAEVSRIVAICLRMLRRHSPGIRLVVSYADVLQGHHGGIYQALNWIYIGASDSYSLVVHGRRRHPRSVASKYGRHDVEWIKENIDPKAHRLDLAKSKHKYVWPMDREMRDRCGRWR